MVDRPLARLLPRVSEAARAALDSFGVRFLGSCSIESRGTAGPASFTTGSRPFRASIDAHGAVLHTSTRTARSTATSSSQPQASVRRCSPSSQAPIRGHSRSRPTQSYACSATTASGPAGTASRSRTRAGARSPSRTGTTHSGAAATSQTRSSARPRPTSESPSLQRHRQPSCPAGRRRRRSRRVERRGRADRRTRRRRQRGLRPAAECTVAAARRARARRGGLASLPCHDPRLRRNTMLVRLTVDPDACIGSAECVAVDPDVVESRRERHRIRAGLRARGRARQGDQRCLPDRRLLDLPAVRQPWPACRREIFSEASPALHRRTV